MQYRSRSTRHLCSELVSVICRGRHRSVTANLEEIGRDSALVLTETPIRKGSSVRITCGEGELSGVVRSCSFSRSLGFFIEVDLDANSLWWPGWFTPKHLLALFRSVAA
jgi:hypothetical protein